MTPANPSVWPVSNLVILDCDSTLTTIEGIDELARLVEEESKSQIQNAGSETESAAASAATRIAALTKRAMEGDLPLEVVYGQRLVAVNPTQAQVSLIAKKYRETVIPDAQAVIATLHALGIKIFIVSGGLIEPVRNFGIWLGVPRENIFAVDMEYDQLSGHWWRYWEQTGGQNPRANYLAVESNPLTSSGGKNRVIARLRAIHPGRALLVGDGLSDLEASREVDLFVGFGGAVYRPQVAQQAPVYIQAPSLAPLLPLAAGQLGISPHNPVPLEIQYSALWAEGLRRFYSGEANFRDEGLRHTFFTAMQRKSNSLP